MLQTRAIAWTDIIDLLYMTTGGIFGVAVGVSSTTLAVFIIFGAFIASTGAGHLLFELSAAAVGKSKGGPAKMAVVGSAFMGSINGAPAANVATIGVLTIPMMKKLGYKPEFAGAVEACSSIGGQFLPPVMGACAFLIVAFTGIPYVQIMKYAVIPALIYFFSVYVTVHLEALKLNLQPVSATKSVKEVLKEYGHMLIPIFVLFYMLMKGYSPSMSGTLCTVLLVLVSFLRKSTRLTFSSLIKTIENAATSALVVITSCAAAGIVVGIIEYTGLGERLATSIVSMGGDNLLLVLFLVMIISLILGMGMPPVPAYVLQVGLTIPALIEIGVPVYIAHLFVFYFCGLSLITPPVAVASYAAAGIAEGNPMSTGFQAFRMAIPSFVVPFIFVLDPALLLVGSLPNIILVTVTALISVCALAIALEGYVYTNLSIGERLLALIAAILLILPYASTALPGLAILAVVIFIQRNKKMKGNAAVSS
ncbi:MAG: TRAP transporter fused permease subunit [Clostridia bacterium]|nr:TRAP transporter fused permease subunit [Clostridia bacterium]